MTKKSEKISSFAFVSKYQIDLVYITQTFGIAFNVRENLPCFEAYS